MSRLQLAVSVWRWLSVIHEVECLLYAAVSPTLLPTKQLVVEWPTEG